MTMTSEQRAFRLENVEVALGARVRGPNIEFLDRVFDKEAQTFVSVVRACRPATNLETAMFRLLSQEDQEWAVTHVPLETRMEIPS